MKKTINRVLAAGGMALLALAAGANSAAAIESNIQHPAFADAGSQPTSIPVGHAEFCRTHQQDCQINAHVVQFESLDEARWQALLSVNSDINTSVVPVTDEDLYQTAEFWTYPRGFGDCEDYALAKRKALIEQGWPASTLLIAVVMQTNGEGHAVLMVRTDRGDLVLDNQESMIKLWSDTSYHFLKRQSQFNAAQWVDIYDNRPVVVASR